MNTSSTIMIFVGLFLVGGVISGVRQGARLLTLLSGVGAALALTAGVLWWE
ncbi:hypothetical protein [Microbispora sp. NPDC049125]|uniref:hypothetical protein n=1 Tax=Microbispora sp. NPDC049125 TaxID=3154929 RepID=UPI003465E7D6